MYNSYEHSLGSIMPMSPYYEEKEKEVCPECDGSGLEYFSCCGDDMRDNINETDLCPTCLEHCGSDGEKCEECDGEGYIE